MNPSQKIYHQFQVIGEENTRKFANFWGISPCPSKVVIAQTRDDFNRLVGVTSSPLWLVGTFLNNDPPRIILLHPEIVAKEGVHKYGDMEGVFIHELVHAIFRKIYPFSQPRWLNEGIAIYLAGQLPKAKYDLEFFLQKGNFPLCLSTKIQWNKYRKFGAYGISGKFVEFLIKKFGREKLVILVKTRIPTKYTESYFLEHFQETYKKSVTTVGKEFLEDLEKKGGEKNESGNY